MPEMPDYSGPFDPDFRFDTLNKDALLRLLREYGEYMVRIDGFWYLTVMNKCGNDVAFDCDVTGWQERLLEYDLKLTARALNIQGDDVATVMKYIQSTPWPGPGYQAIQHGRPLFQPQNQGHWPQSAPQERVQRLLLPVGVQAGEMRWPV